MRTARALCRLARATTHGLHGLGIVLFRFPSLDDPARMLRVQWWAARMLRLLGVRIEVSGEPLPGAKLLVANHISWLDILAIDAVHPARFVSKVEVKRWPLLGRLVTSGGTLYLERERPRDALRVVHHVAQALEAGDTVAVFPEGTTSAGHDLLPFHANMLQAAISANAPVQAVALRYSDRTESVSQAAAYVGDTSLVTSLWRVATASELRVKLVWLVPHDARECDRRELAQRLHGDVTRALNGARREVAETVEAS